MTNLQDVIKMGDDLCLKLYQIATDDSKYCDDLILDLENYARQINKMSSYIKEKRYQFGG